MDPDGPIESLVRNPSPEPPNPNPNRYYNHAPHRGPNYNPNPGPFQDEIRIDQINVVANQRLPAPGVPHLFAPGVPCLDLCDPRIPYTYSYV